MQTRSIIVFMLAFALAVLAANHRWGDSAHAIGIIKASGGRARHAAELDGGRQRYTLIATATVMPPYRGDARVVLEGPAAPDYRLSLAGPAIDLGIRRTPRLEGNILHDLRPRDRIALWVVMRQPDIAGQCVLDRAAAPDGSAAKGRPQSAYHLAFYDTRTSRRVLDIPVEFTRKEVKDATPSCCQ